MLFLVTRNLGDGLRLFLAGLALEKVLGTNLDVCIIVIGIATIVYTFFGGMKAVIWSDCLQLVIYVTGGIVALQILISYFPGGWGELWEFGQSTNRFRWFNSGFSADGVTIFTTNYNIWAGVIGGAALTLGTHGTDQMFVQRYLSSRGQRDAAKAVIASGVIVFLQFALFLLLGVALACFYDRIEPRTFEHNDQVFATFIVDQLPVGVVGLTLAAVFAAAMSTLSSSLNSSAAAAVSDFYRPWVENRQRESRRVENQRDREGQGSEVSSPQLLGVSRAFTVLFGLIQIGVGIGASRISRSVVNDALAIAGFTAGLLLGVFALGIFTKSAHQRGVLAGFFAGIAVLSWVKFATPIAWPWYAIIGAFATFVVGYVASLILPPAETPAVARKSE
ncbi:MAG: sodium:solute symporter family transporter, partial [Rubripirellula sp.]